MIEQEYRKSRNTYGSPRVFQALKRQGIQIGRKRVERLMRETGLRARVVKHYRRLAGLHRFFNSIENQRLDSDKPTCINQLWAGDIVDDRSLGKACDQVNTTVLLNDSVSSITSKFKNFQLAEPIRTKTG